MEFYADKQEYDAAVKDVQFTFEKLKKHGEGDGVTVVNYLYRPANAAQRKLPVIVFARGSAPMGDAAPQLIACFHRLASQGFIVLAAAMPAKAKMKSEALTSMTSPALCD